MRFKSLGHFVRFLRRTYPATTKCRISVVPQNKCEGMWGYFQETTAGRAVICLSAAQSDRQMQETLLEEYAHLLRHDVPIPVPEDDAHDGIFWAILGELTRKYRE